MLVCEYGRERRRVLAAVTVAGPPANAQLHLRVRAQGGGCGDRLARGRLRAASPAGGAGAGRIGRLRRPARPPHVASALPAAACAVRARKRRRLRRDAADGRDDAHRRPRRGCRRRTCDRAGLERAAGPGGDRVERGSGVHAARGSGRPPTWPSRPTPTQRRCGSSPAGRCTGGRRCARRRPAPSPAPSRTASRPTPATGRSCCSRRAAPSSPARPRTRGTTGCSRRPRPSGGAGLPGRLRLRQQRPRRLLRRGARLLRRPLPAAPGRPEFAAPRAASRSGFTMDDHDYGPRNNADRTTARAVDVGALEPASTPTRRRAATSTSASATCTA